MLQIEKALKKLEKIADRHICSSRRERLQEIISLLKEESRSSQEPRDLYLSIKKLLISLFIY
jgi:hypothetical protein